MQNLCNLVISAGQGPFCSSWLAGGSTNGQEVVFPDSVPRGTIVEVGESTVGNSRACSEDYPSTPESVGGFGVDR